MKKYTLRFDGHVNLPDEYRSGNDGSISLYHYQDQEFDSREEAMRWLNDHTPHMSREGLDRKYRPVKSRATFTIIDTPLAEVRKAREWLARSERDANGHFRNIDRNSEEFRINYAIPMQLDKK